MGLQQADKNCKRSGQKIIKALRKLGIECEFILDKRSSDLGPAILRNARSKATDLIVLTASRGPLNQTLFGRTMRNVLSGAKEPVTVIHS
jgi:nucleotide-binding universal stress UspA family protein